MQMCANNVMKHVRVFVLVWKYLQTQIFAQQVLKRKFKSCLRCLLPVLFLSIKLQFSL